MSIDNLLRTHVTIPSILCLLLTCNGCSLLHYQEQAEMVSNAGVIKGSVKVTSNQPGQVILLRFHEINGALIIDDKFPVAEDGKYEFSSLPGKYIIAVFIDENRDGRYQKGEHGTFHTDPLFFEVRQNEQTIIPPLIISGPPPTYDGEQVARENINLARRNTGRVISLDDPIFSTKNYTLGTWQPLQFLQEVGGGLFMLQPYEKGKQPLIFVHGINSGPTDWRTAIDSIDRDRVQPWVFYYPSGLRLDDISKFFAEAMAELDDRYRFKQFSVAAHSMGGLITRSFVKKYTELYPTKSDKCKFVMTVNSPLNGLESAAMGVSLSPIVVASWKDVATDSQFIVDSHKWQWPKKIPYYLVFSYQPGDGSDDVVPLDSQIPFKTQLEASRIYGFTGNHVQVLSDKQFVVLFNQLIAESLK